MASGYVQLNIQEQMKGVSYKISGIITTSNTSLLYKEIENKARI